MELDGEMHQGVPGLKDPGPRQGVHLNNRQLPEQRDTELDSNVSTQRFRQTDRINEDGGDRQKDSWLTLLGLLLS